MRQAIVLFSCIVLAVKASDVLDLKDSDFKDTIKEHSIILVEFFAPWCGHCKKLAPEYEQAATALLKNDPPVPLAKVDCTEQTSTCSDHGVTGYPTLKIFRGGVFNKDYDGPRESNGIIKYMAKLAGPTSKELKSVEEYEQFLSRDGGCVVGFFTDAESNMASTLKKVADSHDGLRFAYTSSSKVLEKAKYKDEIVLFRPQKMANKFEDTAVKFSGDANSNNIKNFLKEESFGLCALRTQDNAADFKKPLVIAFFDVDYVKNAKGSNYWRNRVMKVGKKLREEGLKVNFAVSNKNDFDHELGECGLRDIGDKPAICAYNDKNQKFKMEQEFAMDTFEQFVRDMLDGKVEAYMKSEPVPDNSENAVKVAVGKNFEELVNDPEKDVLIEFYAPWCGHCKSLAPKYDELAEKLQNEPEIVIAKMDATANDVPSPYDVRGFPTIYFAPKGSKSSPKKYEGGREVNDFVKYLAKEATNELQGFDRKGKKKSDKKKKSEL